MQDSPNAAAVTVPRTVSDAEYEFASTFIARIRRAVTDLSYRLALIESYAVTGRESLIPNLVRIIDSYRVNDAGELVLA